MIYKLIKYIVVFAIILLLIRYVFLFLFIWGILELLIYSINKKSFTKTREFICNFVLTVLNCIDILFNIILQFPANRILLTTTESKTIFGNPKQSFIEVLRINFVYNNLKQRGIMLYKIIMFFKKSLK